MVAGVPAGPPSPPAVADEAQLAVSVMLMGGLAFFMSLFYLVNWPDKDIRYYSSKVISSTIAIFCGVLIFESVKGVVENFLHEEEVGDEESKPTTAALLASAGQLVLWLVIVQDRRHAELSAPSPP